MLISLIGYRGTGKTTIGSLLADRLDWRFIDSDQQIEHDMGMSIRRIFEIEGEGGFRQREATVIAKLVRLHKAVLSLGGGAILREENRRLIKSAGPVVWLTAPPEVLLRRITGDPASAGQRPQLTDAKDPLEEIIEVLEKRRPLYEECADITIETSDKSPSLIVEEIIRTLSLSTE